MKVQGFLFLALAAVCAAGCERETRDLRLDPPIAAALDRSQSMPNGIAGAPPEIYTKIGKPYAGNAYQLNQGKRLFEQFNCRGCHGDGGGAAGPALMDGWWSYGPQVESIFHSIRDGRPNGMPSFARKLTTEQMWQLAGYVQKIGAYTSKPEDPGRNDEMQGGNEREPDTGGAATAASIEPAMKRVLFALVAAAAMLALGGCAGWQSALDPHGVQAAVLARLISAVIIVCTVVWLLVTAVLLRAIWRRRPEQRRSASAEAATEGRTRQVVTVAMIATLVVVLALTTASFFATRSITGGDPQALVIQVRAWQWWWEVTYPDAQPDRRILTANEIHVPVGRPVRLELAAADVIHSFWVPNLAGKQDMIPGRDNVLSFTASSAGVYRGQCAEFCGLQHAHMAFLIIADEPAEFEAWRARQLAPAIEPTAADAIAGRAVFLARECTSCHTVRGTPAAGTLGPDLTHVGSRRTIAAGLFDTTRGSLAAWIADPQTLKPGNNMPMVDLGADELKAVAAYLASLQ